MSVFLFARNHRAVMVCGLMILQFFTGDKPVYAESRVFKCTGDSGQISFSQTGCKRGISEPVLIDNPEVGWINLQTVVSNLKAKADRKRSKRPQRKRSVSRSGDRAQKQRCWRARKKVARIARELKQGYRLARGEELRYQRTEQEEYLALFCRQSKPGVNRP